MTLSRRALLALPVLGPAALAPARAQDFSSKPIRIVVPAAAGIGTDAAARYLGAGLSKALGTPVVVENKVGADGMIGTDFVAKAAPDGHTLLFTFAIHYIGQWMEKVPYDAVRDFEPVARYGQTAVVLVTAANSPFRTVKDLVDAAKQRPGMLTYGSAAPTSQMAAVLLEGMAGIKLRHVPYKSSPQSSIDTASGLLDVTFGGISASLPLLKSGRLRALAVTTAKRSLILPDVPTMAEAGLRGYDFSSPNWVFAPRGTPPAAVAKLSEILTRLAGTPEFRDFATAQGFEADVQDAATVKAGAAAELEKWGRMVAAMNVPR